MKDVEIEFYWRHLEYIINQIKMADNKMNFLLAIYSSLLGIMSLDVQNIFVSFNSPNLLYKFLLFLTLMIFIGCLIVFYVLFIKTISPKVNPRKILNDNSYKSIIFWKDLSFLEVENFKDLSVEDFTEDLKKQILINSRIAVEKFDKVKKAYQNLVPTLISFAVLKILIN